MKKMNEFRKAIVAVAEHALAVAEHGRTVFQVTGTDALDLLHRLSTNDLLKRTVDKAVTTVFCNEKGRVIEAAEVVSAGSSGAIHVDAGALHGGTDQVQANSTTSSITVPNPSGQVSQIAGGLYLICSNPGAQTLLRWIEKFTITEDIHFHDVSDVFSIYYVLGPHAIRSIEETAVGDARVWQGFWGILPCVKVLCPKDSVAKLFGNENGILVVDSDRTFEFLRVLHSVPLHGHEIAESYNPYEVGLRDAISFTKGCYIGQEVIARLDTYGKVQKELRMLWSDALDTPHAGTPVVADGQEAGVVTSSTAGLGRSIILAVLKKDTIHSHEVFRINGFPYVLNDTFPLPYSLIFRQDPI
jgi:folate-binding protein YgfZ